MVPARLLALLALPLAVPATALAAVPRPNTLVEDHRHYTHGHDWHVQLEVNRTATRFASIVVYSQECKQTGFAQRVPFNPDGTFGIVRDLPDGGGRFELHGKFFNPDRATGLWRVTTTAGCDVGGAFKAQDASGHFLLGNPFEYPSDKILGSTFNARRLRALKWRTQHFASAYDTPAEARRAGYKLSRNAGCPGMNHGRKYGTKMWGKVLDARHPQSIVFWCDGHGGYRVIGVMFRAPGTKRPPTYGNLIQWHKHGARRRSTWMTHIWFTNDWISAFATCAPIRAFESMQVLTYHRYIAAPGDEPCSDTVKR